MALQRVLRAAGRGSAGLARRGRPGRVRRAPLPAPAPQETFGIIPLTAGIPRLFLEGILYTAPKILWRGGALRGGRSGAAGLKAVMRGVEKPDGEDRERVPYLDDSGSFARLPPAFLLTKQNGVGGLSSEVAE